jgi:hypothetical protein
VLNDKRLTMYMSHPFSVILFLQILELWQRQLHFTETLKQAHRFDSHWRLQIQLKNLIPQKYEIF